LTTIFQVVINIVVNSGGPEGIRTCIVPFTWLSYVEIRTGSQCNTILLTWLCLWRE